MHKEINNIALDYDILANKAYKSVNQLQKRKNIYKHEQPKYNIEEIVIELLHLKGNERVLDVGCGPGKLLLEAARERPHAEFIGIDISSGIYENAEREAKQKGLKIDFSSQDVQKLNFSDNTFDRITAIHVFHHVPNVELGLEEIARVLKPHGFLVLTANSLENKPKLRKLKSKVANRLDLKGRSDTSEVFNIDTGTFLVEKYFEKVNLLRYKSTITLKKPKPYVDYFDSTRDFWRPPPTDKQWKNALKIVEQFVQEEINKNGYFEEKSEFGAFVASL